MRRVRAWQTARQAGLKRVPRSVVSQPMRWRDGVLRPDRSALDPSILQLWYGRLQDRAIRAASCARTEPMSSLVTCAARSLERKVASHGPRPGAHPAGRTRLGSTGSATRWWTPPTTCARGAQDAAGGLPQRGREAYNQSGRRAARLRSAPRTKPTDVPKASSTSWRWSACPRILRLSGTAGSREYAALALSSSLDVRLRSGDRALAWMLLAVTSLAALWKSTASRGQLPKFDFHTGRSNTGAEGGVVDDAPGNRSGISGRVWRVYFGPRIEHEASEDG